MIISIDGLDCSGKETLAKVLGKKLSVRYPFTVRVISFPDYTSNSGQLIKKLLSGELSTIRKLIPDDEWVGIITRLFVINRAEFFATHKEIDPDSEILVFDRYSASNILYQGQGLDEYELSELIEFNNQLDYELYKNPKPTISIFLRVPFKELTRRLKERKVSKAGVEEDIYENFDFLKSTYHLSEFLLTSGLGSRLFTNCINQTNYENGQLIVRTADECADGIISFIDKALGKFRKDKKEEPKVEPKVEEKPVIVDGNTGGEIVIKEEAKGVKEDENND